MWYLLILFFSSNFSHILPNSLPIKVYVFLSPLKINKQKTSKKQNPHLPPLLPQKHKNENQDKQIKDQKIKRSKDLLGMGPALKCWYMQWDSFGGNQFLLLPAMFTPLSHGHAPCLAWTCASFVGATPASVSSNMHQSYCIWKSLFPRKSSITSGTFHLPFQIGPWAWKGGRGMMKTSHLGRYAPKSLILCPTVGLC